jgi:micrococcal nuclease
LFTTRRPAASLACWLALAAWAVLAAMACGASDSLLSPPDSATPPFEPTPGFEVARLVRVIDGDTIVVEIEGVEERLRYIGIDTPEFDEFPDLARRASDANAALLDDGWLQFEKDVSERDFFGRLLRYVWVDGRMVNEELVRQGEAVVSTYPPDVKYVERFIAAQDEAQAAGVGVWAAE